MSTTSPVGRRLHPGAGLQAAAAWLLGLLWIAPLAYAFWASVHREADAAELRLNAPLTMDNFAAVWQAAPFGRYYLNTVVVVTGILAAQLVIGTLAAYAFARLEFRGRELAFAAVLVQLMVVPEVLITQNFQTVATLGLADTLTGIGVPYLTSGLCIFLLRQTFKTTPLELREAAQVEGASELGVLWRVYVPLARPTYVAFGLVSISYHWNSFLWPLVVSNSPESRTIAVGLSVFNATEAGIDLPSLAAATVLVITPLLASFVLLQRQFVQGFLRAGIR